MQKYIAIAVLLAIACTVFIFTAGNKDANKSVLGAQKENEQTTAVVINGNF